MDNGPWLRGAVAIDHIRNVLKASFETAAAVLQTALYDGEFTARCDRQLFDCGRIPSGLWQYSMIREDGSVLDMEHPLDGLIEWFDVPTNKFLAKWPIPQTEKVKTDPEKNLGLPRNLKSSEAEFARWLQSAPYPNNKRRDAENWARNRGSSINQARQWYKKHAQPLPGRPRKPRRLKDDLGNEPV